MKLSSLESANQNHSALDVVAHTFNFNTALARQRQGDLCEANLIHILSSRQDRAGK